MERPALCLSVTGIEDNDADFFAVAYLPGTRCTPADGTPSLTLLWLESGLHTNTTIQRVGVSAFTLIVNTATATTEYYGKINTDRLYYRLMHLLATRSLAALSSSRCKSASLMMDEVRVSIVAEHVIDLCLIYSPPAFAGIAHCTSVMSSSTNRRPGLRSSTRASGVPPTIISLPPPRRAQTQTANLASVTTEDDDHATRPAPATEPLFLPESSSEHSSPLSSGKIVPS